MSTGQYYPVVEIWKPIPDTAYEASSRGRIRHAETRTILSTRVSGGYVYTTLHIAGKRIPRLVSRLVCSAFHGASPSHYRRIVAHKDDNKLNNRPTNLYWATHPENSQDAFRNERRKGKLTAKRVAEIRRILLTEGSYGLGARLAKRYGVTQQAIYLLWAGKTWRRFPCPKGCGEVYTKRQPWVDHSKVCKGKSAA